MDENNALIALHKLESHFLRQALHFLRRSHTSTAEESKSHYGRSLGLEDAAQSVRLMLTGLNDAEPVSPVKEVGA